MQKFLSSRIVMVLLAAVSLFLVIRLFAAWRSYAELAGREDALAEKVEDVEAENEKLRGEIRISDTPEAIERDGKARLNMKKPGEEVVVVVLPEIAASASSSAGFWARIKSFFR